jgi:hypothetical protein
MTNTSKEMNPKNAWGNPYCANWHGAANHMRKEVCDSWHQYRIVPPRRDLWRPGAMQGCAASDACPRAGWHYSPLAIFRCCVNYGPRARAHRSHVHEGSRCQDRSETMAGLPRHPFGVIRLGGRHAMVYGRSHSTPRRCDAPRRTSGCDLGPATDLDLDSLLPVVPACAGPESQWRTADIKQYYYLTLC